MHRLFVAIRPAEAIRDLLIDVMEEGAALGWVSDDHLHLTLRYIGEVERPVANDIADALGRVRSEAFELRIAGVGTFDRRGGGVLWAAVTPSAPVVALAAKVERACLAAGVEPEHRAFHPHITLARWRGARTRELETVLMRNGALSSEPFEVTHFGLVESHLSRHGAHYERVASYRLRCPTGLCI
jgi:2'-5' RNA ligase